MANEIQYSNSLSYTKGAITTKQQSVTNKTVTVSGINYALSSQTIATSATALDISNLAAGLGWAWFRNTDATNPVDLMTSTSGAHFATLLPGESAQFRFSTSVTAPAAIATSASVVLEFFIVEP